MKYEYEYTGTVELEGGMLSLDMHGAGLKFTAPVPELYLDHDPGRGTLGLLGLMLALPLIAKMANNRELIDIRALQEINRSVFGTDHPG